MWQISPKRRPLNSGNRLTLEDVDIILLEGIYLLKRALCAHFDLTFWVDCTFETALGRALRRGQEGLPVAETVRAYETIYFPAQRIHFAKDNPRAAADLIIKNDPRLDGETTSRSAEIQGSQPICLR